MKKNILPILFISSISGVSCHSVLPDQTPLKTSSNSSFSLCEHDESSSPFLSEKKQKEPKSEEKKDGLNEESPSLKKEEKDLMKKSLAKRRRVTPPSLDIPPRFEGSCLHQPFLENPELLTPSSFQFKDIPCPSLSCVLLEFPLLPSPAKTYFPKPDRTSVLKELLLKKSQELLEEQQIEEQTQKASTDPYAFLSLGFVSPDVFAPSDETVCFIPQPVYPDDCENFSSSVVIPAVPLAPAVPPIDPSAPLVMPSTHMNTKTDSSLTQAENQKKGVQFKKPVKAGKSISEKKERKKRILEKFKRVLSKISFLKKRTTKKVKEMAGVPRQTFEPLVPLAPLSAALGYKTPEIMSPEKTPPLLMKRLQKPIYEKALLNNDPDPNDPNPFPWSHHGESPKSAEKEGSL